ncbi:VOC family protein [Roseobacteraceae bacterium S113]
MILNYVVLGTNDLEAAIAFYNALFADAELQTARPSDRMHYWIGAGFAFALARPFDGGAASTGNGTMTGFSVGSAAQVRRLHARALALGATCAGEPGPRGPKFSAYLRDLDGNKLCLSD